MGGGIVFCGLGRRYTLPLLVAMRNCEGRFDARDGTEAVCWGSVCLAGFVGPKASTVL